MTRVAAAAALAPVAFALTACGAQHARSTGTPSNGTNQQALTVLRQLAGCVRAHGLPGFPDPVVGHNGVPVFPDSAPDVPPAAQQACRTIVARMPADYTSTTPVSASDFQKLLALARCIRSHGVHDWPDPNALGEFPIDSRIQHGGKVLFVPAVHACARLDPNPDGGIHVIQARP
jgi:hypothetical protein